MNGPRLLCHFNRPVGSEELQAFKTALVRACDPTAWVMFMPEWVDLYQLVDGLWQPLDPGVTPAPAGVLERDGVTTNG